MKQLLKSFHPKQICRLKKSRSVSKSAPNSFGSASYSSASSDSSSSSNGGAAVAGRSATLSGEWSDGGAADSFQFDYVQAFKMIDLDGDGKITRVELESILRRVGGKSPPPTAAEVEAMIGDIDRDGDGCISLDELQTFKWLFESTATGEDELREAFDCFDADHDGKITAEELHSVFVALGDKRCTFEDCRRMIESVDKNGDGFVCFEDFTRMMELQR